MHLNDESVTREASIEMKTDVGKSEQVQRRQREHKRMTWKTRKRSYRTNMLRRVARMLNGVIEIDPDVKYVWETGTWILVAQRKESAVVVVAAPGNGFQYDLKTDHALWNLHRDQQRGCSHHLRH
jgi:hypothetical protein